MHLSHSGLQLLLTCPASYFLSKKQGISLKTESKALQIGSAFHWGCEHNTEDLSGYLKELDLYQINNYNFNKDVIMASGMVHGYLKHKDDLFDQILTDYDGVTKLSILDESHELDLVEKLASFKYPQPHEFHGIIDLLLLTEKGWIILDYKTSSQRPDWDKYLDQILRYCWLIRQEFPDIPVYKIGIINVRKTAIRKKDKENDENFLLRIKREYDINDDELISYHEFSRSDFEESKMNRYIENLSRQCDFAQMIEDTNSWFINYGNAVSVYGKSEYWDLFYQTPNCEYLYKIEDEMFDENFGEIVKYRDCKKIDMIAINDQVMNHFKDFENIILNIFKNTHHDLLKGTVFNYVKKIYKYDSELLEKYWNEYERKLKNGEYKEL